MENAVFGLLLRDGLVPNTHIFYYKTKSGKEVGALFEASEELSCKNLNIITIAGDERVEDGIKIIKYV
ncbi:hypothetical protein COX03_03435 [Candidatus Woesebacteria bacterium CG22_combo_CG10-13_8_21_14_all_39_10]|uniref:Uncharacterized protein n=2 Tax=Candidatus Woeseibacteriota TaxID=1752722 RepID=A0A2H0BK44_9BACT|nr:MAG: hypothetical protein COX03_03435 [Candidatus Woesebacteria bacterium CG22_combo_CG10-13_8_21_14_all_39_10]PIZ48016.1 MAG: hypothetical protein COY29_04390 [Candidatus Woesebacteria bacterium CG_4_10_14_0_2_um_filter_39_14]